MADELKKLQKELNQQILRPFQKLAKINLNISEKVEGFSKALNSLPSGEILRKALEEWIEKTKNAIEFEKQRRNKEFSRIVNEFIKIQKEKGIKVREFSESWRIGCLEMELKNERSEVRLFYNKSPLTPWKTVTSSDELSKFYDSALRNMERNEIPLDAFSEAMQETYEYLKAKQKKESVYNPKAVPALEFMKELNVVLYRKALDKKLPKLKDTSKWVFLYNLDLYLSKSKEIESSMRIYVESGSQVETRTKAIYLNGLDASKYYCQYCYFKK